MDIEEKIVDFICKRNNLGVSIDSKQVKKGDLFFAIKGERIDAHDFLKEVSERGATAAVIDKSYDKESFGLELFRVENVVHSFQLVAKKFLESKRVEVIAITGSVGKTTTKEFIAQILSEKYKVYKNPFSYNSQIGLPLSILNMDFDAEILILEMGMSKRGEIAKLVEIAHPDIAVITKIALCHAENFEEGLEGIAGAKAEVLSKDKTRIAIVNSQVEKFNKQLDRYGKKRIQFSLKCRDANYFLSVEKEGLFVFENQVEKIEVPYIFKEEHHLENLLAAIAVARYKNMDWKKISSGCKKLTLPKMRFEKQEIGGILFINDAYNANPEAMTTALRNLPEPKVGGKKIAVLGSMKELGKFSEEAHLTVGLEALKFVDLILCLGKECAILCDLFKKKGKRAELFEDHASLARAVRDVCKPGDVVLVKGSRSMAIEKIFSLLKF